MLKNGAIKLIALLLILYAANLSYGFVHEAAHALVVKTFGGEVYELYVNPMGTDAYTVHSYISGLPGTISLEMAGMAVTTLLAFFMLLSDYAPLPLFMAVRTTIYSLNYSPGTDIYIVWQALGNGSYLLSAILVALNLACAAIAITALIQKTSLREPVLKRFLHF
jgi:hypothetical protein